VPLGAVIAAPNVWEPFWTPGTGMFRHGYTYSGHATASAVALANLDIIDREGSLERARQLEGMLADALAPLADHPLVSEVRSGTGVLAAVQIEPGRLEADPALAARLVPACRRHGIMGRVLATGALQISPPLVLTDTEVDELTDGLRAALDDVEA
jgi:adenosylmethionine-8-amino-7-oxononanoate aminotransferase